MSMDKQPTGALGKALATFQKVWFLAGERVHADGRIRAFDDVGDLLVYPGGLAYHGRHDEFFVGPVLSLSLGKQGRDFANKWIWVQFGPTSQPRVVYFSDGRWLGWGGIFGGTRRMFAVLQGVYDSPPLGAGSAAKPQQK